AGIESRGARAQGVCTAPAELRTTLPAHCHRADHRSSAESGQLTAPRRDFAIVSPSSGRNGVHNMRLSIGGLRAPRLASTLLLGMLLAGCATSPATSPAAKDSANHPPRHVFVIILENEPFQVTFGERSPAPYLADELPKQG